MAKDKFVDTVFEYLQSQDSQIYIPAFKLITGMCLTNSIELVDYIIDKGIFSLL